MVGHRSRWIRNDSYYETWKEIDKIVKAHKRPTFWERRGALIMSAAFVGLMVFVTLNFR